MRVETCRLWLLFLYSFFILILKRAAKVGRNDFFGEKTAEQMKAEYREVISLLSKGYSIRDMAKLSGRGVSTVQRVKRLIKVQSSQ